MNVCSEPYKKYHFLKECNDNFQMQYVNCLNKVRFLAKVSTKLQKMHFFIQFKNHNSGTKHENYRNKLIFFIYFFHSKGGAQKDGCQPMDYIW